MPRPRGFQIEVYITSLVYARKIYGKCLDQGVRVGGQGIEEGRGRNRAEVRSRKAND
jgi:hypothetical protein